MLYFFPDNLSNSIKQIEEVSSIQSFVNLQLNECNCIFEIYDILTKDHLSNILLKNLQGEDLIIFKLINLSNNDYQNASQHQLELVRESELKKFDDTSLEVKLCKLILKSDINDFQEDVMQTYMHMVEKHSVIDMFYLNYYYLFKFHILLNNDSSIYDILAEIANLEDCELFNSVAIRYLYDFYLKSEKNRDTGIKLLKIIEHIDSDKNQFNFFKFKLLHSLYTDHRIDNLKKFLVDGFSNKNKMIVSLLYPNYHCYIEQFLIDIRKVINLIPRELLSRQEIDAWQ